MQTSLRNRNFAAYSTIWLGRALPEDGYLLTIEGRATHAEMAQKISIMPIFL